MMLMVMEMMVMSRHRPLAGMMMVVSSCSPLLTVVMASAVMRGRVVT